MQVPGYYVVPQSTGSCTNSILACPPGTSDEDSSPSTPCLLCNQTGYYLPESSYGSCVSTSFLCNAGTSDHDFNSSTPCTHCPSGYFFPQGVAVRLSCEHCQRKEDGSSCPFVLFFARFIPNFMLCLLFAMLHLWFIVLVLFIRSERVGSSGPCNSSNFTCNAGYVDDDDSSTTACIRCAAPGYFVPPASKGSCTLPSFLCGIGTSDDDDDPSTECLSCSIPGYYLPAGWLPCWNQI